jgi:arginyl-tRNA--protein-N-Asp/Glu arginylyltransferase
MEKEDKLSEIYNKGFLPYSGAKDIKNTFYMARSARVSLSSFTLNSENRRVAKKFDGLFDKKYIPIKSFSPTNNFYNLCLNYFKERHGESVMPLNRLKTILSANVITDVVEYSKDSKTIAYIFIAQDEKMGHFWYSFYDTNFTNQSLGMWLMVDISRDMKNTGKDYFYVGTVYGEKSLYKTNFDNLQFWDGSNWIEDTKTIRSLGKKDTDKEVAEIDKWKENMDLF